MTQWRRCRPAPKASGDGHRLRSSAGTQDLVVELPCPHTFDEGAPFSWSEFQPRARPVPGITHVNRLPRAGHFHTVSGEAGGTLPPTQKTVCSHQIKFRPRDQGIRRVRREPRISRAQARPRRRSRAPQMLTGSPRVGRTPPRAYVHRVPPHLRVVPTPRPDAGCSRGSPRRPTTDQPPLGSPLPHCRASSGKRSPVQVARIHSAG